jgi:hypothetical protein
VTVRGMSLSGHPRLGRTNGRSGHVRYIPIATEMVNRLREVIVTDDRGLFAGLVEHFARAA